MNVDAKLLFDSCSHCLTKANDVFSRGTSTIDEDKRLTVVNASKSQMASLPTTLFNEPTRRNLHTRFIHSIVRHCGILLQQVLILGKGHDGIHKETACIALLFGVRKFLATDVDDDFTQLLGSKRFERNVSALKFSTYATIVETRLKVA